MKMEFDVFTLLPEVFSPYLDSSILQRARQRGLIDVRLHNIRDWAADRHHVTDDVPYGGGGGMVMKPEPVFAAVESVLGPAPAERCPVVLLTPQGRVFTQQIAVELSSLPRLALLCGRYEGVDERIRQHLVTDEISIGDYVLTGGELPALILIDAISRLLPGVLGDPDGAMRRFARHRPAGISALHPPARITAAGRCPTSCFPVTMRRSKPGAASNPCSAPWHAAPTCWKAPL